MKRLMLGNVEIMISKKTASTSNCRLLLDNIRSVHNVGSIFRTADTLGIEEIYCVGTTPSPVDRFGRKRQDLAKVSLGAEDSVKWLHLEDGLTIVKKLKKDGFKIIALEQSPESLDYKSVQVHGPALIILGNEVDGVDQKFLKQCDVIAEIDMKGKKESLNVSVATAVFLYRLLDK
jgi:23S rRNA (guanosine2251-2'-O)-methyltransferase